MINFKMCITSSKLTTRSKRWESRDSLRQTLNPRIKWFRILMNPPGFTWSPCQIWILLGMLNTQTLCQFLSLLGSKSMLAWLSKGRQLSPQKMWLPILSFLLAPKDLILYKESLELTIRLFLSMIWLMMERPKSLLKFKASGVTCSKALFIHNLRQKFSV
jgi:hypothetical protein